MRRGLSACAAIVLVACISKVDADPDTVLTNPNDPTDTVKTTSDVVAICGTICDALIEDYGVPSELRSACVYECAVGFDRAPEACYQLVACVADRSLCSANDVSPGCLERAGDCLPHWSLANGTCRNCWQPSRTVKGKQIVTYLSDGVPANTQVPEDFSKTEIAALLPRASLPPYRFAGTGNPDGTYSIKSVPGCGVWIQVGKTYTWATNADVDTSYSVQGRTGFERGDATTVVRLEARNLVPWTDEDWLYFFSPQVQTFNGYLPPYDPTSPDYVAPGSTDGTFAFDLNGQGMPDPLQKDVAYVQQLSAKPLADGSFVRTVTRTAKVATFAPKRGQDNPLVVDLVDLPPTRTTHLDFKRSAFEKLVSDLHPQSVYGINPFLRPRGALAIWGHPGRARVGATGEVVVLDRGSSEGDIQPTDVAWSNPYDASWGLDLFAGVNWYVVLTDRAGNEFSGAEVVQLTQPFERWDGTPVVPRVSPPRNVRIDGRVATSAIADANLSLTPTVSWDVPALGEPDQYEVEVHALMAADRTGRSPIARFVIPKLAGQTSPPLHAMTVPPDILARGTDYYFRVVAAGKADDRDDAAAVVTSEYRP